MLSLATWSEGRFVEPAVSQYIIRSRVLKIGYLTGDQKPQGQGPVNWDQVLKASCTFGNS